MKLLINKTNMKYIVYFFIVTSIVGISITNSYSQCPENTQTTDPNNYNNSYDLTNAKLWDWMTPTYDLYIIQNQAPTVMNSPFYDLNQRPNIDHLNDVSKPDNTPFLDYLPADGWELLYKNFGTTTQAQPTPHFLLYNKYSGIIRAFVLVANSPTSVQGATVSIQFNESGSTYYETALLNNFGDETKTCEDYEIDASKSVPNEYLNPPSYSISDNWMFAEFSTMYDPCTCVLPSGKPTELRITVDLLNQANIELESFGTISENISSNGIVNTNTSFQPTLKNLFDAGMHLYKDGEKGYKDGTSWANDATSFFNNNHDKIGPIFYNLFNHDDEILHVLFSAASDALPYVGVAFAITKSVISLVKKYSATANPSNRVQPTVKIQKLQFKTTGTLTTSIPVTDAKIALPGSPHSFTIGDNAKKPVYNNVLGVFGMLKKPVIEYVEYQPYIMRDNQPSPIFQNIDLCAIDDYTWFNIMNFKPICEFKLKDPIQYVINPESNLTIKDIKFCYVINTQFRGQIPEIGPRDFQTSYGTRISNFGYMVELMDDNENYVNAQISTPYLDPKCFENWTIKAFMNQTAPFLPEISIRVKVILEPTLPNPSSNVEEILLIYTYPVTIQTANDYNNTNNRYFVDGNICAYQINDPMEQSVYDFDWTTSSITSSPFTGSFSDIPMIQVIENETLGTNTYATSTVFIRDNAILQNNSYFEVAAGEKIKVSSTVNPVHISNYSRLKIDIHPCFGQQDNPPTDDDINTFCSTTYLSNFNNSNRMMSMHPILNQASGTRNNDKTGSNDIGVLPNPNNGEFSVYIRSSNSTNTILHITDLSGKTIHTQLISIDEGVNQIYMIKPELPSGTYFIRVDGFDEQVKMIITQ
jgi:hypothetical protein